ncbi:MAG: large extracellular alpha-helical protein [Microbacterium sp.]|nr:large extracellular alpha-helical protein [Microbacterium sp.]
MGEGPPPPEQRLETTGVGPGPLAFIAPPIGDRAIDVAAIGAATASSDDLSGFAASACRPPLLDSWLVGGSGATGAADLVLLANPGTVPATVQLTVYGAAGAQAPPGGVDLVVPPGTQRVVPLAGIALGEETPVVRVSAVGAPIRASLQASITRTLTPGGVDQVGPVAQAATSEVITGITVMRRSDGEGEAGAEGGALDEAADDVTVLRMLAPSAAATARVTVTAVGNGEPVGEPQEVALEAGKPLELALDALTAGSYTVAVDADAPIVAAVWQATGVGAGDDFAWYTPAPEVAVDSLFATPGGPTPSLSVVNPSSEPVAVAVTAIDGGSPLELTVPANGSVAVRLSARTVYRLQPEAPVRAGLSFAGDGAVAGVPVWPADTATPEVVVYP